MSWISLLIGALTWVVFSIARAIQQKQITELEKGINLKKEKMKELEKLIIKHKTLLRTPKIWAIHDTAKK